MDRIYIPDKTEEEIEEIAYSFPTIKGNGERFHIGQSYEEQKAEKQICITCKGDKFEIARGSYFTAIRCPNCGWEECIHEG